MRIIEKNAVYIGDDTIGYRCIQCNQVVSSMFGDICNSCRQANDAVKEQLKVLKEVRDNLSTNQPEE